ncbi:hypothetical protein HDR66_01025 [bacterium]|nr:hypothetical protein [bacterium]
MSRILQIRRGTAAQNDNFTGLPGEVSFDTDAKTLRVHDGEKLGGYALARADSAGGIIGGDINIDLDTIPDDVWAEKIAQFAIPGAVSIVTSRTVAVAAGAFMDYVFQTDKTPFMAAVSLVCLAPDAGYAADDVVDAFGIGDMSHPVPNLFTDDLGTHVRLMIGEQSFWVCHKTSGIKTNCAANCWGVSFRLYC